MTLRDALSMAASGLRGNIVRTILSILGLAVGVGAVLTVLTLGDAGEARVENEIEKLGVNKVWIRAKAGQGSLAMGDSGLLGQATGAPACAGAYTMAQTEIEGRRILAQVAGFDDRFERVYSPKVLEGRLFYSRDYELGKRVCLIDESLAEQIGEGVIGQGITINFRRIRVIGVIKGMSAQTMSAGNGMIVMPLKTYMDTFGGDVAEITLSVQQEQDARWIADKALNTLSDGYRADTLEEEINAAREVVRIFVMVLICVAAVCMLTGGIGIMNVLLLTVRERKREIGLIKAVGGTAQQICILFLLEAATYSVLGGLLGIVLGWGMTHAFSDWIGLSANLELDKILIVLAAGASLGAFFGVIPALNAARLEPVDALQCD